jgi:hypothetical protein
VQPCNFAPCKRVDVGTDLTGRPNSTCMRPTNFIPLAKSLSFSVAYQRFVGWITENTGGGLVVGRFTQVFLFIMGLLARMAGPGVEAMADGSSQRAGTWDGYLLGE